jgi:hypothetical protein
VVAAKTVQSAVEPKPEKQRLVVVTAYPVEKLKRKTPVYQWIQYRSGSAVASVLLRTGLESETLFERL